MISIRSLTDDISVDSLPNSIPATLGNLLQRAGFVSMIQPGEKLCVNKKTFVDGKSWYGMAFRTLNGENRGLAVQHVRGIVDEYIRCFEDYPKHKAILIKSLISLRKGIENLSDTYSNDPSVVSSIKIILTNIDLQINKYGNRTNLEIEIDKANNGENSISDLEN